MDVIYQTPASGIAEIGYQSHNHRAYRVQCECTSVDHALDVWIEVEPDSECGLVELTIIANLWTPVFNGILDRIKAAWNILFKGVHKQEHSILLNHQSALNFAETLTTAINDLQTRKSINGNQKNG